MEGKATLKITEDPDIIRCMKDGKTVMRIAPDGRIYWNGKEVLSDDDFRSAMLELKEALMRDVTLSQDARYCRWDFENIFSTTKRYLAECGESYVFDEGTPKENQYNFCPNCSGRIIL